MQVAFYDWTTYWSGALRKGQGALPLCVLRLIEAARDDDADCFAEEARDLPSLELAVAQMIFERIEELPTPPKLHWCVGCCARREWRSSRSTGPRPMPR